MNRIPTDIEVRAWFANRHDAICIVAGRVSGCVECIDFDCHGECFEAWKTRIDPDVYAGLVVERTPSGGYHVVYRLKGAVEGSKKLAQGWRGEKLVTLIETRGEGGLFLCAPTDGYVLLQGSFMKLPVLSESSRERLLAAARAFDEVSRAAAPSVPEVAPAGATGGFLVRPGDDFDARGDIRPCLRAAGWQLSGCTGKNELWTRPGKNPAAGASATFNGEVFYVFSSNAAPFEPNKGYGKFQVYALLEHGGDFTAATRTLLAMGYGRPDDSMLGVDISGLLRKTPSFETVQQTNEEPNPNMRLCTIGELLSEYPKLREPIIHGLLRKGETMNLIAPPKLGKSWLVGTLAIAVAEGTDWMGFPCETGRVLVIDNELHHETLTSRYRRLMESLGVSSTLLGDRLLFDVQRGNLKTVNDLISRRGAYAELKPDLVIIDAFYRTLPEGTEENDNAAMTRLYNKLDIFANAVGCAIILVHHTSKGSQALKSVTDSGAGAGAISRAADTHVVLRRHKEPGCAVVDAVVRSWPAPLKFCVRFNNPLWERDDSLETEAIEGLERFGAEKVILPEHQIIKALVDLVDPEKPLSKTAFIDNAVNRIMDGKIRKKDVRIAFEHAEAEGYIKCTRIEHAKPGQQAAKVVLLGSRKFMKQKEAEDNPLEVEED